MTTASTNAAAAGELLASPPRAALSKAERQREREELAAFIAQQEADEFAAARRRRAFELDAQVAALRNLRPTRHEKRLFIAGAIDDKPGCLSATDLLRQMRTNPARRVIIEFDSRGGDLLEASAMAAIISQGPWRCVAEVRRAASAAVWPALACHERQIYRDGSFLIHAGTTPDSQLSQEYDAFIAVNSHLTREAVDGRTFGAGDWILDAREAIKFGLAHTIT